MVRLVCQGFTSFRANQRLWLYLYLTKLGLALIVTIPVLIAAQSTLDNTLYSTPLLKEWSLKVIGELIAQRPFVLGNSLVAVMVFGFLALVIRQFVNGGVYLGYSKIQRISRREFFGASGEKFGTHLRITGVMAIFYLLFGGIGMWLGSITGVIVGQLMPKAGLLTVAVPVGVLGLVLIPAVAFSDMLRAVSVKSEGAPIRRLLVDAFTFYRLHWVKTGRYVCDAVLPLCRDMADCRKTGIGRNRRFAEQGRCSCRTVVISGMLIYADRAVIAVYSLCCLQLS